MNKDSTRALTPLRSRLRKATADAILAATEGVLAEQGLVGATMQAIAARAGVSVGTVYNHFRDRDELLKALFVARREALAAQLAHVQRQHARAPFRVQLESFVRSVFAQLDEHRAFLRVALENELTRAAPCSASPLRQLGEHAARIVRAGVKEGALRAEHADLHPAVLTGMMRGTLVAHLENDRPLAGASDAVIEIFLHGALVRS